MARSGSTAWAALRVAQYLRIRSDTLRRSCGLINLRPRRWMDTGMTAGSSASCSREAMTLSSLVFSSYSSAMVFRKSMVTALPLQSACRTVHARSPAEQPHNQRKHHAQEEAGNNREVEKAVLSPKVDVSRQAAKAQRQPVADRHEDSQNDQNHSEGNQHSAQPHSLIITQTRSRL